MITTIGKYIVIDEIKEEATTDSGLIIDSGSVNALKGKVYSAGNDVVGVKDGDEILYQKSRVFSAMIDGKKRTIIKEADVIAVV